MHRLAAASYVEEQTCTCSSRYVLRPSKRDTDFLPDTKAASAGLAGVSKSMASPLKIERLFSSTPSILHRTAVPPSRLRSPAQFPHQGPIMTFASRPDSDVLAPSASSSSQAATRGHKESLKQGLAGAAASLLLAAACAPAGAYNVRLQDVENKAMQAGRYTRLW